MFQGISCLRPQEEVSCQKVGIDASKGLFNIIKYLFNIKKIKYLKKEKEKAFNFDKFCVNSLFYIVISVQRSQRYSPVLPSLLIFFFAEPAETFLICFKKIFVLNKG